MIILKPNMRKKRESFREASPKHVVTFEVDISEDNKRKLFSYAEDLRNLSVNTVPNPPSARAFPATLTQKTCHLAGGTCR